MEFLKALKEAERVGVSRQEFKKVWELQERLNTMRASTQRLWQGLGGNQDSQTGVQDLKAEMHQLKQEITKLRKDLVTRCVALDTGLSSNICQHNQDLEDIKNVLSQLKNEILRLKTLFNAHLGAPERQILSSKNSLERHHTADMSDKRLGGYFVDTATQTCDEVQSEEGKILGKAEQHSPELEPRQQQQQLKEQHQQNDGQQMMEQQGKQWDDQGQCWKVIADIKTLLSQCHNTSENLDPKISSHYNSSDELEDLELGVPVTVPCDGSGASVEPKDEEYDDDERERNDCDDSGASVEAKGEECDDDEEEERNDMKVEAHTCSALEKEDNEVDVHVTVTCDDSRASVEAKSKEYDDEEEQERNYLKVEADVLKHNEVDVLVTVTRDDSGASVKAKGEEYDGDEESRNDLKVEVLNMEDNDVDIPTTVTHKESSAPVEAKGKEYDDADREETNDLKVEVHTSNTLESENNDVDIPVTDTRDDCGASVKAKGKEYADDKKEGNDPKAEAYTCNMLEIEEKAQQHCGDQNSQELQQRHAQRGGQISLPVRQHNQHQGAQKSEECHDQNSQELHEQQQGQESPPVRQQNQQQEAQTSKGDDRQLSHQDKEQKQNQETSASTSTLPANEIKPGRSAHDIPFLPTDGIVFQFKNVGSSASEGTKLSTPFYRLTDCPVSVGLSIWFDHKGFLNTQLLITVLNSKPGEGSRIFEFYGDIKNKTAVKFSPLFYGESQIKINTTSCAVIDGDVSLETNSGSFSNITLQELNRRGYVMDDSIFIDWIVIAQMSEECHDQNSQELHEQQQGQESLPVRQQNQQQGAQTSKGDDRQLSHRGKEQQQNQETSASTSTWPANEIKPGRSAHDIPFLPTDGIVFQFKNIGSSASEGTKLSTPFYRLTDCPVSVGLSIWFDHKGHLNTQVLISVLCSKPREGSRMFELYGDIKNTTSVKFTPLLYGESQIKMNKTSFAVIDGDVSLETSRGVYPDITLEELNRRGYVTDDSIFIDWVVISRKVTADTTSKQAQ